MEQGIFHLIKPKHCNTEYKKKVSLCPSLGSAQSVKTHNLGWYHDLNTNIAGKEVKPTLSQSLSPSPHVMWWVPSGRTAHVCSVTIRLTTQMVLPTDQPRWQHDTITADTFPILIL